jgi:hypothetical protein
LTKHCQISLNGFLGLPELIRRTELEEVLADRKKSGITGAAQIEDIVDHLLVQFGCDITFKGYTVHASKRRAAVFDQERQD